MNAFPPIYKYPNKNYFVACDSNTDNDNNEFLAVCIAYKENGRLFIQHSFTVVNKVQYQSESPLQHYLQQLSSFYKVPVALTKQATKRPYQSKTKKQRIEKIEELIFNRKLYI